MALENLWSLKMTYKDELMKAMKILAENEKTIFIGQTLVAGGSSMKWTMEDIPKERMIELPVMEEVQMGISLGLSLEGYIPVSVYPRFDFLILAINQLVNHIDKTEEMSEGRFKPKVIIRTAIGSVDPLMPGPQHCQDHTEALKKMCTNINIVKLERAEQIVLEYKKALESDKSTVLIEIPDMYNKELEDKLKETRAKTMAEMESNREVENTNPINQ